MLGESAYGGIFKAMKTVHYSRYTLSHHSISLVHVIFTAKPIVEHESVKFVYTSQLKWMNPGVINKYCTSHHNFIMRENS